MLAISCLKWCVIFSPIDVLMYSMICNYIPFNPRYKYIYGNVMYYVEFYDQEASHDYTYIRYLYIFKFEHYEIVMNFSN